MFRYLQGVFSSMSLERKCLLLFGSVLVLTMCAAFWIVDLLAGRLVIDRTHQVALDYGAAKLNRVHADAIYGRELDPQTFADKRDLLNVLEAKLLQPDSAQDVPQYEYSVLSLEDAGEYDNLPEVETPANPVERRILENLETKFRRRLTQVLKDSQPDLIDDPIELEENAPFTQISPNAQPVFEVYGPIDDRYIHYRPVFLDTTCLLTCHSQRGKPFAGSAAEDPEALAAQYPFRVIRVSMPYRATRESYAWIRAVVIALGMLIIAVTLYVLHSIVRYLVLHPLHHLRDVSDAITHGDIALRATIETEDEFRELADAFNRMLRHLVETQDQIQEVNRELDRRVDQLAQLNLQLYEANRLKSDFLANMSHELRTPLNSIIGFSEVLQGIDSLTDKQRRYAANIRKSGRVLLEMINDILDLAKVEAGKMEMRPTRFQIAALVQAQADMVRSLSEEKNIELTVDVEETLPEAVQDQNKLGQILTNLLSNAIKFTPEGGRIWVRAHAVDDERFELSVTDTGVGIAEEDQSIIFEKFRQSRQVLEGEGLTREFAGTGLGLSIVKELTKLLGGEVSFESELGRGSTFRIRLPLVLPPQTSLPSPPLLSDAQETAMSGESINTEILNRQET